MSIFIAYFPELAIFVFMDLVSWSLNEILDKLSSMEGHGGPFLTGTTGWVNPYSHGRGNRYAWLESLEDSEGLNILF